MRFSLVFATCLLVGIFFPLPDTAKASLLVTFPHEPLLAQSNNDEYAQYYVTRAVMLEEAGDYQGSLAALTVAINSGGKALQYIAYKRRGDLMYKLGNYSQALSAYDSAFLVYAMKRPFGSDFKRRGLAKAALRDFTGAIQDFTIAIDILSPRNPTSSGNLVNEVYVHRGNAFMNLKDFQKACSDFKMVAYYGHDPTSNWLKSSEGSWC